MLKIVEFWRKIVNEAEIVRKVKRIDRELNRRRLCNKIDYYNKDVVHIKQMEFHKCQKRNRWVFGGNRSGKTECGAVEAIWMLRGIHPYRKNRPNCTGWVVSLSSQVQRDVAQRKILSYLKVEWIEDIIMSQGRKNSPDYGIIDTIIVRNVFGGLSRLGFKSCDQGREKFQGTSLDFVWVDEEPSEDVYNECRMRVVDKCGDIFGTMTPLKGLTFIYNEIFLNEHNDDEVWHIHMSWEDNPYLNAEEIAKISATMSADELDMRKYGRFCGSSGLVYPEFDEAVNVIDPFDVPKDWYVTLSIDPGLKNPLSCHWYAMDNDDNIYVIAEHFEADRDIDYHASKIKEISDKLEWHRSRNGMIEALIDSAATQRTLASSKSVADLFYERGICVNVKVNKDLFSGISRVKSLLRNANGQTKLYIFRTCTNLIRELKSYFWGKDDVPKKYDDHALDELRYFVMSNPHKKDTQVCMTPLQKEKERLIRKLNMSRRSYG